MGGAKRFTAIISIFVGLILLSGATFTIDEKEQAIITQFGKYIRTIQEPGLHFKIPIIQTLHLFEKRVLTTDAVAVEYITVDKKRVVVDHVSRWKIEDPLEFYRSVRTEVGALARLEDILVARLRQEIATHTFIGFIREEREKIVETVAKDAHEQAKRFGIKIIDVRIKRADLPKDVQASVFARMQAERHRIAKRYRAEGEERSREIKAETDKEKEIILAKAYQQQMKLFGEGDARATEVFASAYEQDAEFYSFLRRLQTYEQLFEGKTMILLESDSELLKYFRSPRGPSK
ncbi:MAG: protease modulator HflC [Deltaproteobacteria bacterium]|nr:MAG: protease modulator HflC [Deltaproteobacteria bacterium]